MTSSGANDPAGLGHDLAGPPRCLPYGEQAGADHQNAPPARRNRGSAKRRPDAPRKVAKTPTIRQVHDEQAPSLGLNVSRCPPTWCKRVGLAPGTTTAQLLGNQSRATTTPLYGAATRARQHGLAKALAMAASKRTWHPHAIPQRNGNPRVKVRSKRV